MLGDICDFDIKVKNMPTELKHHKIKFLIFLLPVRKVKVNVYGARTKPITDPYLFQLRICQVEMQHERILMLKD